MRNTVKYEWTFETIEDGDIVDSDFSDQLDFDKTALQGKDLGLVRNEGNEHDGVQDRQWAYVKDGKLPGHFQTSGAELGEKIPERFHTELKKYL